jgi:hypothetical protein
MSDSSFSDMNTTEKLSPNDKLPAPMQVSYKPDSEKAADALAWLFGSSPLGSEFRNTKS